MRSISFHLNICGRKLLSSHTSYLHRANSAADKKSSLIKRLVTSREASLPTCCAAFSLWPSICIKTRLVLITLSELYWILCFKKKSNFRSLLPQCVVVQHIVWQCHTFPDLLSVFRQCRFISHCFIALTTGQQY